MIEPERRYEFEEQVLLVHAYLDGELSPVESLSVQGTLAKNPVLAHEERQMAALRDAIQSKLPSPDLPPDARRKIEAALGIESRRHVPYRALAASMLLAIVVGGGATWLSLHGGQREDVFDAVVANHMRGLMSTHMTDVDSSDRHTVKPWFNGRIAQSPRVVDLGTEGFRLMGARLDMIGMLPVPTIVYGRRSHVISVSEVPAVLQIGKDQVVRTINGFHVVSWQAEGVGYRAASDLNPSELRDFARLFQSAPTN